MPMEKKVKTPEEKEFNKRWGKIAKKEKNYALSTRNSKN